MDIREVFYSPGWPTVLLTLTVAAGIFFFLYNRAESHQTTVEKEEALITEPTRLGASLAEHLPNSVFFQRHPDYIATVGSYWSQQQRDITPQCVVKPHSEKELSTAVTLIKKEFDACLRDNKTLPTFAVRSGGHSTVPEASNATGGVVIDLGLFNNIEPAKDRQSVVVGSGARWGEVSRKLDSLKLAVAGGRNSDVGVGGLTLGGGYSYFSPRSGFVCDNVLEYRIVLASSAIVTASEHENPQLWNALKGGGSNFGVAISFRLRAFPCTNVWSGFLYMFSWKTPQVLSAFHKFVKGSFDASAGGPLLCISYVQQIGMQIIATHLMYTEAKAWADCWSEFRKIGRIWSSTKIRTLTSTTDELDGISPAGFRQLHISTTIKNDLATIEFAYAAFNNKVKLLRKVKGMVWTLVLQPLHLLTMKNGDQNMFGLQDRQENLVIVLFTAVWENQHDDDRVNGAGRSAISEIDRFAADKGTADSFRYLNWSDGTQRPFESYGKNRFQFLKETSKQFDPDGFFQLGCVGGHKLGGDDGYPTNQ